MVTRHFGVGFFGRRFRRFGVLVSRTLRKDLPLRSQPVVDVIAGVAAALAVLEVRAQFDLLSHNVVRCPKPGFRLWFTAHVYRRLLLCDSNPRKCSRLERGYGQRTDRCMSMRGNVGTTSHHVYREFEYGTFVGTSASFPIRLRVLGQKRPALLSEIKQKVPVGMRRLLGDVPLEAMR